MQASESVPLRAASRGSADVAVEPGRFDRYQEADVSEYGKSGRGPHDHLFPEF
jgi:hypothetical protein